MQPLSKVVIPVAGHGTRLLPATKATPKEMLPVVDKPVLQYLVEEAAAAGLHDVLLITGRNKRPIEDHFDRNAELEQVLRHNGDRDLLAELQRPEGLAAVHYLRQGTPRGVGHAVLRAEQHIGDEPFAVLLGDDLIDAGSPLLPDMIKVQQRLGGCVLALTPVAPHEISAHGCAATRPARTDGTLPITDLMEGPRPDEAAGNYAVIGRYVLPPEVFEVLRATAPGRGGELQLADALATLARQGTPVHGVLHTGRRFDTGDPENHLRTAIQFACERPDIGPTLRSWLDHYVRHEMPRG
ncbi:UTP--glucose-1-phosphate uridylyltransferase [Streptomyces yunnanensis]|uniref:UTP--glucose-1-phosphate uridylyltransferase n=1 Tax=Streptomyces yunnanensis TaxID=156453 RepID=A0A9X8QQQ8_9ACTN|nr:UTP--glucose-1-phosphate uridylyltransferase [Streptomyces yunnanensis]SHL40609.1 UTP--glucose-1-phosphate uridylyltransferase [Streptomyces yunnanensis]